MAEYDEQKDFTLGAPALVCRWRLRDGVLPLENRHVRALSKRRVNGAAVTPELVAWAKQHMEWSLDKSSAPYEDGVLMLVVDGDGKAAMASAEYEPLADTSADMLAKRAKSSVLEGEEAGVSPEVLVAVRNGSLKVGMPSTAPRAGALSFLLQLAESLGIGFVMDENLPDSYKAVPFDELFLVSDEHGVVVADGFGGPVSERFADSYERILEHDAKKKRR
jgi:hypothetical protein